MAKLLIIHGVGFFESDEVLRRVGTFAPSLGLKIEDTSASPACTWMNEKSLGLRQKWGAHCPVAWIMSSEP